MFKFMLNNNSEIMFYDTESHIVFSLGYFLAKIQKNTRPYQYQIISPLANCYPAEGGYESPDEEAREQFLDWVSQGEGYPRIFTNPANLDFYFDEMKIFKDGGYHGINDTNKLWDLNATLSSQLYATICRGFSEVAEEFKEYSPIYFCYNSTAASTTNKTLQILSPESVDWIKNGAVIHIFNENTNTATNPKFYIQNKAIPIYYGGQPITTNNLDLAGKAGQILTYYIYFEEGDNNQDVRCAMYMGSSEKNILTAGTNITIDNNTISATDTKNTAGSTDTSSKIYLIGATSQAANPQTYSDNEVFAQDGVLNAQEITIGARKSGSTIGTRSFASGNNVIASAENSHAEGYGTIASGERSHAEGGSTYASSFGSHSEGGATFAVGNSAHAEGGYTIASGVAAHSEGGGYTDSKYIYLTGEANATTYTTSDTSNIKIGDMLNRFEGWSYVTNIVTNTSITVNRTLSSSSALNNESCMIWHSSIATGNYSHAEGYQTQATAIYSHAEGANSIASGRTSHAEGEETQATGYYSHADGYGTIAQGYAQHASGIYNIAQGYSGSGHSSGDLLFIVGNGTSGGNRSNAFTVDWGGKAWFSGDVYTGSTGGKELDSGSKKLATEDFVTSKGYVTTDTKNTAGSTDSSSKLYLIGATSQAANPQTYSDNEVFVKDGVLNAQELTIGSRKSETTIGTNSIAEGVQTTASGYASHAEGSSTQAIGYYSHAEGYNTQATNDAAHAEGYSTQATHRGTHAEGYCSKATSVHSHAEGSYSVSMGDASHAEGYTIQYSSGTIGSIDKANLQLTVNGLPEHYGNYLRYVLSDKAYATGDYSIENSSRNSSSGAYTFTVSQWNSGFTAGAVVYIFGVSCANGTGSHSEGQGTYAADVASHSEGKGTIAAAQAQHVEGTWNIVNSNLAHIVGNGTDNANRSNAYTLDWNGNGAYAGKLTVGTGPSNNMDVATKKYVDDSLLALPEPMIFKGSLGTEGTITTLPAASASNEGYTYKVITAGTYASQSAKIGDTFISDGSIWVLIPSGDEPNGTVTSVKIEATGPIAVNDNSAITTSGVRTISHSNSGVTAGTYRSITVNDTGHVTAGTNPTTISGYGITDAKIASGVITLGSNTITPLTSSSTLDATKVNGTLPTNTYTDTKNTAGSTDTSSKIYLVGATEQSANPQTYSDNEVYATNGTLTAKEFSLGTNAKIVYNTSESCIEFSFS